MSKRAQATQRLENWLNDMVSHWALVLWLLAALGVGFGIGLLVAGGLEADWVEASGTWASVAVTLAAVVVAYRAFTTESFDRLMERHTATARRQEEFEQQQRAAEVEAAKVTVFVTHHGADSPFVRDEVQWWKTRDLAFTFENLTTELVVDLWAQLPLEDREQLATASLASLEAGANKGVVYSLRADEKKVDVLNSGPDAQLQFIDQITLWFDIRGQRWQRVGANPPTRVEEPGARPPGV